jgi:hypothetical protein
MAPYGKRSRPIFVPAIAMLPSGMSSILLVTSGILRRTPDAEGPEPAVAVA